MIIDGQKWSCETCIKGHRASTCEHFDRQLVLIKKKGRPSTQCLNCRELRAVRQLHRRCDCLITKNNEPVIKRNDLMIKENMHGNIKGRKRHKLLRPLAPKQHVNNNHVEMDYYHHQEQGFSIDYCGTILHHQMLAPLFTDKKDMQPLSLPQTDPTRPTDKKASCCNQTIRKEPSTDPKDPSEDGCQKQASPGNACCSSKARVSCCSTAPEDDPPTNNCCSGSQTDSSTGSLRPPLSCLGPAAKNQQGEIIRLVTCRCGDDCACVGCDAHPSRAMKEGKKDVYIGFNEYRRFSISAAIPFQKEESIPSEDGMASLCGCGCSKRFDECSNCLLRLCSEYDV